MCLDFNREQQHTTLEAHMTCETKDCRTFSSSTAASPDTPTQLAAQDQQRGMEDSYHYHHLLPAAAVAQLRVLLWCLHCHWLMGLWSLRRLELVLLEVAAFCPCRAAAS